MVMLSHYCYFYSVNFERTENYKEKCHVKKECNTTVNVITPSLPIHLQRKSKCSTAKCQQEDFWGGEGGSHLFCLAGRQEVPEDWRLEISEYNNAVIMEEIGIIATGFLKE